MNNKDFPRVTYKEQKYTMKDVNKIFQKMGIPDDVPEELINIRKNQLLNHSRSNILIGIFYKLFDLVGERDYEYNRTLMNQWLEQLFELHTPIYLDLPGWPENANFHLYEWKEWELWELYEEYWNLCSVKGWIDTGDFYSLKDRDNFRKFEVLDMLNDLLYAKKIILYDVRSFGYEGDSLGYMHKDDRIAVKILKEENIK